MELWLIIVIAIVGFFVLLVGGVGGYLIWIGTRPKKITWKCKVYQLGEGVMPPDKDSSGQIIANYKLSGLVPYTTDVIERVDKKSGATHYWLKALKKATPVVTADCVENWGKSGKWVSVLLEGDTVTLIKAGYDVTVGKQVFKPMPHDRINMIKTEVEERKERIENTKDVLAQITPFVVVGISMLALVVMAYFMVQGAVKIGEMNIEAAQAVSSELSREVNVLLEARGCLAPESLGEIVKEEPPTIPP